MLAKRSVSNGTQRSVAPVCSFTFASNAADPSHGTATKPRFSAANMPPRPTGRGRGAPAAQPGTPNATPNAAPNAAPPAPEPDHHIYAAPKGKAFIVKAGGLFPPPTGQTIPPARAATLVTRPEHGTVVVRPDGGFTYTPARDYVGVDVFTYKYVGTGPYPPPETQGAATVVIR